MKTIYVTSDPAEAEMIRVVLRDAGIESTLGNTGAAFLAVGMPTPAAPLTISVEDAWEAQARGVVEGYFRRKSATSVPAPTVELECPRGHKLEFPEGTPDAEIECPWCGWKEGAPPATPGARAGKKRIVLIVLGLGLLAGVVVLGRWGFRPGPGSEDRAGAWYKALEQRAARIPSAEPPALDLEQLCGSLRKDLGDEAEALVPPFPEGLRFEELAKANLAKWAELHPDMALSVGFAESPRLTRYGPSTTKAIALLNALTLRELRRNPPSPPSLDSLLFEIMVESEVMAYELFGPQLCDPTAGLSGLLSSFALLDSTEPAAAEDLSLLGERVRQVPEVVAHVRRELTRPPRILIETALEDLSDAKAFVAAFDDRTGGRWRAECASAGNALEGYRSFLEAELPRAGPVQQRDPRWIRYLVSRFEGFGSHPRDVVRALKAEADACVAHSRHWSGRAASTTTELPELTFREYFGLWAEDLAWARAFARESGFPSASADDPPRLALTPAYFRRWQSQPGYLAAVYLGKPRGSSFWVTPWDGAEGERRPVSRTWMKMNSVYAAYPGSRLQEQVMRERSSVLQRLYGSNALTHGWPAYCERLACEALGPSDPAAAAWWYHAQAGRAWFGIMETCLGSGVLSEDEAISFLRTCQDYDATSARRWVADVARYTFITVSSVMGESGIRRLRSSLEAKPGFDPLRFHRRLLELGRTPLHLVRREMEK